MATQKPSKEFKRVSIHRLDKIRDAIKQIKKVLDGQIGLDDNRVRLLFSSLEAENEIDPKLIQRLCGDGIDIYYDLLDLCSSADHLTIEPRKKITDEIILPILSNQRQMAALTINKVDRPAFNRRNQAQQQATLLLMDCLEADENLHTPELKRKIYIESAFSQNEDVADLCLNFIRDHEWMKLSRKDIILLKREIGMEGTQWPENYDPENTGIEDVLIILRTETESYLSPRNRINRLLKQLDIRSRNEPTRLPEPETDSPAPSV